MHVEVICEMFKFNDLQHWISSTGLKNSKTFMCLWSNCFSWFCPLAPYVIIWPIVQSHGGCGENRRLLLCMVCKFSWPEVLVLSVFTAHRDLSICMTLKIKKSFSLVLGRPNTTALVNMPYVYHIRLSFSNTFSGAMLIKIVVWNVPTFLQISFKSQTF